MFMLAVFWSSMAVQKQSAILSILSWVLWHILSALHLTLAYSSSVFGLEWVFFGLGILFLVLGIAWGYMKYLDFRKRKEFEFL